jgi:hypothetical protein
MRLLVCGGRDYSNNQMVVACLNAYLNDDLVIITGYDPDDVQFQGADQLAYEWARRQGVPVMTFPAAWRIWGRSAGPRRNARMVWDAKPQQALAFPGGNGTADAIAKARAANIPVKEVG